jgi:hypothetical protein
MNILDNIKLACLPHENFGHFPSAAARALIREPGLAETAAEWLDQQGVTGLGTYQHGSTAFVVKLKGTESRHPHHIARIAPYMTTEWDSFYNRAWTPLSLQPSERELFSLNEMRNSFDCLIIEIMLSTENIHRASINPQVLSGTGIAILRPHDAGVFDDGTHIYLDADSVNLVRATGEAEPYAWLNPAWRQQHMKIIYENTRRLGLECPWVIEQGGVFYTKQQKLYGDDYLTARSGIALRAIPQPIKNLQLT